MATVLHNVDVFFRNMKSFVVIYGWLFFFSRLMLGGAASFMIWYLLIRDISQALRSLVLILSYPILIRDIYSYLNLHYRLLLDEGSMFLSGWMVVLTDPVKVDVAIGNRWHSVGGILSDVKWWAKKRAPGCLGYIGDNTTQLCAHSTHVWYI